jgi:hypothetical protein
VNSLERLSIFNHSFLRKRTPRFHTEMFCFAQAHYESSDTLVVSDGEDEKADIKEEKKKFLEGDLHVKVHEV